MHLNPTDSWDPGAVSRFSARLESFAISLSQPDRCVLLQMILAAMDPLDRIKYTEPDCLSLDEEAIVRSIEAQKRSR